MQSLRFALMVLLVVSRVHADRRLVWSIDLAQAVKEPSGWGTDVHKTEEVAFSPDGRRIAVTLSNAERTTNRSFLLNTHLLIVNTEKPRSDVREFDLVQTCGVDLTWNERGDAIHVCGTVVQLTNGATCRIDLPPAGFSSLSREFVTHQSFWLNSDRLIRSNGEIVDLTCGHVSGWPMEPLSRITGVDFSHKWALIERAQPACESFAVDFASHRPFAGWPKQNPSCFAEVPNSGTNSVCSRASGNPYCYSAQGGTEIPIPGQFSKYRLAGVSQASKRVILENWTDSTPWWIWLNPLVYFGDYPGGPALPQLRVVLDMDTGKAVSSWKPRIQQSTSPHVEDWPFHAALSGDGAFVAESGEGLLELYQLQ